jgi:hypothetical protein
MSDNAIHADPDIAAATPEPEHNPAPVTRADLRDREASARGRHQNAVAAAYAARYDDRHGLAAAVTAADTELNAELARIASLSLSIGR